ncbi:MAG: nitronate monooxygenase [Rhodospirillales bacterium]|nr:nitronate monooxygenase [Rhodospirillales bacterium]
MPIPRQFAGTLSAPIIAAPMFLVSGPDLVVETCRAGMVGTFPALNQRTTQGYEDWLVEIQDRLAASEKASGREPAPFGVNLVVHKSNSRLQADIAVTIAHEVPLIITSLGAAREVVDAVHSYGGLVFHDVINMKHARKAAEAGVDGLIAVAAGAGGHAGLLSPFAMVSEIRQFFDKAIILSGVMSHGQEVAAARAMGADFAYLGTRFIATHEAMAAEGFKEMIVESTATDIVYTPAISGVNGNFIRDSIANAGRDPDNLTVDANSALHLEGEAKVWKDIWSAGQGVGGIHDILSTADLCARLTSEYRAALAKAAAELEAAHVPTA